VSTSSSPVSGGANIGNSGNRISNLEYSPQSQTAKTDLKNIEFAIKSMENGNAGNPDTAGSTAILSDELKQELRLIREEHGGGTTGTMASTIARAAADGERNLTGRQRMWLYLCALVSKFLNKHFSKETAVEQTCVMLESADSQTQALKYIAEQFAGAIKNNPDAKGLIGGFVALANGEALSGNISPMCDAVVQLLGGCDADSQIATILENKNALINMLARQIANGDATASAIFEIFDAFGKDAIRIICETESGNSLLKAACSLGDTAQVRTVLGKIADVCSDSKNRNARVMEAIRDALLQLKNDGAMLSNDVIDCLRKYFPHGKAPNDLFAAVAGL
jgi:hypothetical protein